MGYGVSHHVRGVHTGRELAALGVTCAILGTNRDWTTFALLDPEADLAAVAQQLGCALVQIWTDDEDGRALEVYAPDGWSAQLTAEVGARNGLLPEDQKLLDELVQRGVLAELHGATLAAGLAGAPSTRDEWIAADGIERAIGVANPMALPWPCTAELLGELVAGFEVFHATAARPARAPRPSPPPAPAATVDPAVVALHVHYWTKIFEMNCWVLYKRYKKHLPAKRRREVDDLINLLAGSHWNPPLDEVYRSVESILAAVWHADDWLAAIRDPRLADQEPLTAERRAEWQRLLGARG